jgi:hypothetical protein
MAITNVSSARRAGYKITSESVHNSANIASTKLGTRTLTLPMPTPAHSTTGAGTTKSTSGMFVVIPLPNANSGGLFGAFQLPCEWVAATDVKVSIYWYSAGITGNVKFTVYCAPKVAGESTASADTQTVITAAPTTANMIKKSQVSFSNTLFAANDWVGYEVYRDPTDGSDTLASDVYILNVVIEFTGRG